MNHFFSASVKHTVCQIRLTFSRKDITFKMAEFERAVEDMNTKLAKTMTDEDLIEIYGLYKQATVGDINIDKPSEADVKVSQK